MKVSRVWAPDMITKIEIQNAFLSIFHVGEFRNLEILDLSGNKIVDIRGCGLEQCSKLYYLNLRNNTITKKENFKAFWYVLYCRWTDLVALYHLYDPYS
jgi:Leucine-rich repeat (LRR) protein